MNFAMISTPSLWIQLEALTRYKNQSKDFMELLRQDLRFKCILIFMKINSSCKASLLLKVCSKAVEHVKYLAYLGGAYPRDGPMPLWRVR